MTEQANNPLTPEAAEPGAPDPAAPQALVEQLRAMRAVIPEYVQLTVAQRRSLIVVAKRTDPDFVQASINSVGASPAMEQNVGSTPAALRQDTNDAQAWTAVEDEARAFLAGVVDANLVRKYRIGQKALATFAVCRRLSELPEHAHLRPHVELMSRLNRFGRKKARGKQAETPVTPAPQPQSQGAE